MPNKRQRLLPTQKGIDWLCRRLPPELQRRVIFFVRTCLADVFAFACKTFFTWVAETRLTYQEFWKRGHWKYKSDERNYANFNPEAIKGRISNHGLMFHKHMRPQVKVGIEGLRFGNDGNFYKGVVRTVTVRGSYSDRRASQFRVYSTYIKITLPDKNDKDKTHEHYGGIRNAEGHSGMAKWK